MLRPLMRSSITLLVIIALAKAPPVDKKTDEDELHPSLMGLEYGRYAQEITSVLQGDPLVQEIMQNISDALSNNLTINVDMSKLSSGVRTILDEKKRIEIDRLRKAIREKMRRGEQVNEDHFMHIDHRKSTFGSQDLDQLIRKITTDLEVLDDARKKEFKRYEMEKEYAYKRKLEKMSPEEREKAQKEHEESVKKHKDHPKVHHPMSKDQLEETWENVDHQEKDTFNPRSLFYMHDIDGNGALDEFELDTLFKSELDKVYAEGNPEDDPVEREEDMNRMREHVMNEVDKNRDGLIELDEFLKATEGNGYEQDEGWNTLDEDGAPFTDEEYQEYLKNYHNVPGEVPPPVPLSPETSSMVPQHGAADDGHQQPGHPAEPVQPGQQHVDPAHGGPPGQPVQQNKPVQPPGGHVKLANEAGPAGGQPAGGQVAGGQAAGGGPAAAQPAGAKPTSHQ